MASSTFQFPSGYDFAEGATPRRYKFSELTEKIDFSDVGTKPWEPFDFSKFEKTVTPIIKLGEEDEDVLLELKARLCRFDKDENQWKERGVGYIKLLKHKETEKFFLPTISIQKHIGCHKSMFWRADDFSDGELKEEVFCARFASVECKGRYAGESQGHNSEEIKEGVTSLEAHLTEKFPVGEKNRWTHERGG
ncbi:hypothetical protein MKX03_030637 [Papaver bracteatum]|nr:hypothetical protein MKX03_030637 [Papaver bracteatum]